MQRSTLRKRFAVITTSLSLAAVGVVAPVASAHGSVNETEATHNQLNTLQTHANAEITRRLGRLHQLSTVIAGDSRLSSGDKATLVDEVNAEITGLGNLQTKIDADTDIATARIDAQAVFTEYRVYALVVPKVWLVRTASDQVALETKLNTLVGKLQNRINAAAAKGKDVASMQASLNDMTSQVHAAQVLSADVARKVLPLQPTDYNNDHMVLSGYLDQLKTAHADNKAAANDAKTIVQALKGL